MTAPHSFSDWPSDLHAAYREWSSRLYQRPRSLKAFKAELDRRVEEARVAAPGGFVYRGPRRLKGLDLQVERSGEPVRIGFHHQLQGELGDVESRECVDVSGPCGLVAGHDPSPFADWPADLSTLTRVRPEENGQ